MCDRGSIDVRFIRPPRGPWWGHSVCQRNIYTWTMIMKHTEWCRFSLLIQCFGCMHICCYEDRCICISSSSCIFLCWILIVFRPVLAPFVLDLICILPLNLMHFARVDPWADKAIHSLVVLWSTTLMWQSMSDALRMHQYCINCVLFSMPHIPDDRKMWP